jgi:hypothetical protein
LESGDDVGGGWKLERRKNEISSREEKLCVVWFGTKIFADIR